MSPVRWTTSSKAWRLVKWCGLETSSPLSSSTAMACFSVCDVVGGGADFAVTVVRVLVGHVGVVVFGVLGIGGDVVLHLLRLRAAVAALDAVGPAGDAFQAFARQQQGINMLLRVAALDQLVGDGADRPVAVIAPGCGVEGDEGAAERHDACEFFHSGLALAGLG